MEVTACPGPSIDSRLEDMLAKLGSKSWKKSCHREEGDPDLLSLCPASTEYFGYKVTFQCSQKGGHPSHITLFLEHASLGSQATGFTLDYTVHS